MGEADQQRDGESAPDGGLATSEVLAGAAPARFDRMFGVRIGRREVAAGHSIESSRPSLAYASGSLAFVGADGSGNFAGRSCVAGVVETPVHARKTHADDAEPLRDCQA
jgi:hypothetical protein